MVGSSVAHLPRLCSPSPNPIMMTTPASPPAGPRYMQPTVSSELRVGGAGAGGGGGSHVDRAPMAPPGGNAGGLGGGDRGAGRGGRGRITRVRGGGRRGGVRTPSPVNLAGGGGRGGRSRSPSDGNGDDVVEFYPSGTAALSTGAATDKSARSRKDTVQIKWSSEMSKELMLEVGPDCLSSVLVHVLLV